MMWHSICSTVSSLALPSTCLPETGLYSPLGSSARVQMEADSKTKQTKTWSEITIYCSQAGHPMLAHTNLSPHTYTQQQHNRIAIPLLESTRWHCRTQTYLNRVAFLGAPVKLDFLPSRGCCNAATVTRSHTRVCMSRGWLSTRLCAEPGQTLSGSSSRVHIKCSSLRHPSLWKDSALLDDGYWIWITDNNQKLKLWYCWTWLPAQH